MASVEKRGDSYRITVSLGYDINGNQVKRRETWTPEPGMTKPQEKKELEREKILFEERCRKGLVLDGNIKFAAFSEKWLKDYAEKQLRPKSIEFYRRCLKRINPAIGHIKLCDLRPGHLLTFYDNMTETGVRDDIKYRCKNDLHKLIKESSHTKKAFSELSGVGVSTIDAACSGSNVTKCTAEKLSKALNMPLTILFEPVNADRKLSSNTIRHYHRTISAILSTAVEWQSIPANPCERVKPPRATPTQKRYLDEVQAKELLERLNATNVPILYRTAVTILLLTGIRRGELCGLEWDDIDETNSIMHIRRTSNYLPGRGVYTDETKNESSHRAIKVQAYVLQMLREYRAYQHRQRFKLGDQWQDSSRIFTTWNGTPIFPDTLTTWFHDFLKRNNLPAISLHSLRHTNATLLIAGQMPVNAVAGRLGHATPATTMRIYTHEIQSANAAAAELLENILIPNKSTKTG